MKKPLTRILLVLLVAAGASQLLFLVVQRGLRRYQVHQTERFTEIFLGSANHDLLLVGSSRTHSGINPAVLDRLLGTDSYNAGNDGATAFEFRATLEGYLVNHPPPATVVLMVDVTSLDLTRKFWNPTLYYPYLGNPALARAVRAAGHNTYLLRALPFTRMLEYDDYIRGSFLKGLLGKTELPPGGSHHKGFLNNARGGMGEPQFEPPHPRTISPDGLSNLQAIVDTCRRLSIQLILVFPPFFQGSLPREYSNSQEITDLLAALARRNGLPLWRHDQLELCSRRELFSNPGHLNRQGADLYSALLARQLAGVIPPGKVPR